MDMEFQPIQGVALILAIAALAVVLCLFGGYPSLPYLGFGIGVAGISISIQQFYIYSLITNVVDIQRKEFYRATSRTLMAIGMAIVLLCTGRISLDVNQDLFVNFYVMTRLGLIILYFSALFLAGVILYFFYPAWREGRGQGHLRGPVLLSDITTAPLAVFSTKVDDEGKPLGLLPSRLLQILWVFLLATCVVAIAATLTHWFFFPTPTEGQSVAYGLPFDLWVVLIWGIVVTLFYGVLFIALVYYVRDCLDRATISPGQSLLSGFLFLFAAPPLFQGLMFAARSLKIEGYVPLAIALACVAVLPCLALMAVFGRNGGLGPIAKWGLFVIFSPAFRKRFEDTPPSRAYTFNLATKGAIAIVFSLVVLVPLIPTAFPEFLRFPWVFMSYGFLALGCAGMTALDLRNASAAFDSIRDTYLTSDMQTGLAHEVINSLRPGVSLLHAPALDRILALAGDDDPLATDKKRLEELREAARGGLDGTMRMITEFRDRRVLFSKAANTRGDLRDFVERTLDVFRKGRSDRLDEWSVSLAPGAKVTAPFNAQALYHALRILLDNAVDATEGGRKNTITVQVLQRDRFAVIEITDTGRGMSADVKDRFGSMQVSSKPKGTGAGTSIAKSFVHHMNGRVGVVHSNLGQGTRIVVELPIRDE